MVRVVVHEFSKRKKQNTVILVVTDKAMVVLFKNLVHSFHWSGGDKPRRHADPHPGAQTTLTRNVK